MVRAIKKLISLYYITFALGMFLCLMKIKSKVCKSQKRTFLVIPNKKHSLQRGGGGVVAIPMVVKFIFHPL